MSQQSLMQRVLGEQWAQLPPALQAHYTLSDNQDVGELDIEFPGFMQYYLNIIFIFGALINRRGNKTLTVVQKWMEGQNQHWKRTIRFDDGKEVIFQSRWEYAGPNELVEYVNAFMGLHMAVYVRDDQLFYRGISLVLKLGPLKLPVPEWLILGHTTIEEKALDDGRFEMDFKLRHPLLGQIYRYTGVFRTEI